MAENVFVFVVCGGKEHIGALHYSLAALKQYSHSEIIVLTDVSRNEVPVVHDRIIDVKTPHNLNHHQASIYLKTAIHKFVPSGNTYCYLDTDVVALSNKVDEIFKEYVPPIIFAPDHCIMDKFSPAAMNCGCMGQPDKGTELRALFKKYKHLTRQPENIEKKEKLLKKLETIKQSKLQYAWISLKFNLSRHVFRLDNDNFLDKKRQFWHDKEGNAVLYEKEDNAIAEIERTTDFRCDVSKNHYWTIHDKAVFDCRCNHLAEAIKKTFDIHISDLQWQHWNGGVFLFDERGHSFLDAWHEKTMHIFTLREWKTRDQGTLIATVWQMGLQNHPTLPHRFNLIADYNHESLEHKGDLVFELGETKELVAPELIHVYHHWADNNWDVWKAVEKRTGLVVDSESNVINALWIGNKLSALELLTIRSFIQNGHVFKLWLYDKLENELPNEVIIDDANQIIPREQVFAYKNANQYGHGKGSYAGFSDVFRYKLLYEHGGWWVDMDIASLKLLDFDKPYFFRNHHELKVVGNVMKCPRGSLLMKRCYEEASQQVNEHNTDWHKPIDILNKHITLLHLENYIVKDVSNEDKWDETSRLIWGNQDVPEYWYFIHWQNEEWRNQKLDKTSFYYNSNLSELLCKYGLYKRPESILQQWLNEIEFSPFVRKLKRLILK